MPEGVLTAIFRKKRIDFLLKEEDGLDIHRLVKADCVPAKATLQIHCQHQLLPLNRVIPLTSTRFSR
jgi:hypothetical protein